jgi:hypothetical protein
MCESLSDEAQTLYRDFAARKKQSLKALKPHLDNSAAYALQISKLLKVPIRINPEPELLPVDEDDSQQRSSKPSAISTSTNSASPKQKSSRIQQSRVSNSKQQITTESIVAPVEVTGETQVDHMVAAAATTTKKKTAASPLTSSSKKSKGTGSSKKRVASDTNHELSLVQPKKRTKGGSTSVQVSSRKRTTRLVDTEFRQEATVNSSRRSSVRKSPGRLDEASKGKRRT